MEAEDIERYLTELVAELKNRGLKKQVRVLYQSDYKRMPRALSMLFAGSLKENESNYVV